MTDYDFMLFPESNQLLEQLGFFFHAEDGIRVADVTGVQTCALPISVCAGHGARPRLLRGPVRSGARAAQGARRRRRAGDVVVPRHDGTLRRQWRAVRDAGRALRARSEERRVGKECRTNTTTWIRLTE